ncbi:MAG: tyrosine-type recombinase/integrase, partial [Candidatus Bathyarchaeia archaeon]
MKGIYDYEERLQRYRRVIASFGVNGEVALRFLDHLFSLNLSVARVSKIASHIPALLRLIHFDLKDAARSDVERVVAAINSNRRWSAWTKHDKKLILRKLVQYAKYGSCDRSTPIPPEVSWIRLKVKDDESRVTPEKLLTPEDFEALVKAADNRRDKAMLYVLFEGALRPGELLSMSVGSVKFKEVENESGKCSYCVISVRGKTGLKVVPLVVSYRPLIEWLDDHPRRTDPDAPLWCSLAPNHKGERLSYRHFRLIIKYTAKKAGLRKEVWPYLFRHSTLTALAKVFTEARLEQFAGWVHGSKMSARYVHLSARDLENAILELHGLARPRHGIDVLQLAACPRCGCKNAPSLVRCSFCGFVLDRELAAKIEEENRHMEEAIIRRIENLERLV